MKMNENMLKCAKVVSALIWRSGVLDSICAVLITGMEDTFIYVHA
jgi:hypothetical protein